MEREQAGRGCSHVSLLLGPDGPPWSGMETATAGLQLALELLGPVVRVDTSASVTNQDRGRVSLKKMTGVLSTMLAVRCARADSMHIPISQNVTGLVRDLALLSSTRAPTIGYLHGAAYPSIVASRGVRAFLLRAAFSRLDGLACLFDAQCDELQAAGVARTMAAVGNVVPEDICPGRARQAGHDPLRVLFLGLLSKSKGFDLLCSAVEGVPELTVTAAGEWHAHDRNLRLGGLPDDFHVPANVRLLGSVGRERVPELIDESDVLVLPSLSEGLPMTVLESMASGLPVLASPVGALRELAELGCIGTLDSLDPAAIRAKLLELRRSYPQALRRAAVGREYALDRYSAAEIANRVEALILTTSDTGLRRSKRRVASE